MKGREGDIQGKKSQNKAKIKAHFPESTNDYVLVPLDCITPAEDNARENESVEDCPGTCSKLVEIFTTPHIPLDSIHDRNCQKKIMLLLR